MRRELLPYEKGPTFSQSVIAFAGHILGASLLFAFITGVAWALGFWVSWLHEQHHFPEVIYQALHFVEYGLFAVDVLLLGYLVCVGAVKFCRDVWRGH